MMFPHTITIYHHSVVKGTDVYSRCVVHGCYWMHKAGISESGKGAEKTDTVTIVASPEATAQYGITWSVCAGDRVVKGHSPDILQWKDLKNAFVVKTVEENVCGSSVDNITLIC